MTYITWACLRYVQEMATILSPQNCTQGSCELYLTPEYQYDSPLRYNEDWQAAVPPREPGHLQHDLLDHCHHTTAEAGLLPAHADTHGRVSWGL